MTTLVACLDEWHQAYVPGRGSSVHDVLLDSAAALLAQIILWWILRRKTAQAEIWDTYRAFSTLRRIS